MLTAMLMPLDGTRDTLDAITLPGVASCSAPSQVAESASQEASDAAAAEEVAPGLNDVDIAPSGKAPRDALHRSTITYLRSKKYTMTATMRRRFPLLQRSCLDLQLAHVQYRVTSGHSVMNDIVVFLLSTVIKPSRAEQDTIVVRKQPRR